MLRKTFFMQMGLAAVLALGTPMFAEDGGKGGQPYYPPANPAPAPTAPAASAPAKPDDKGVDPATPAKPDDKGVDPAGQKADDKGVDPANKADDKGVDPANKADDKGVDPAGQKADDKGVDPANKADDKGVDPANKADDKGVDPANKADDKKTTDMKSAPDGDRIRARGQVEIQVEHEVEHQAEQQREHLRVRMDADANNGTAFIVWVNGKPAGAIIMKDAHGELQLENEPGKAQPDGVFPVSQIKNVSVVNNIGALVLRADF